MHELSMAQGIINAVLETAEANNATEVNEVTVEVGRLAMINPEQLEFILGVLIENTIMEDAKFPQKLNVMIANSMVKPYLMTVIIMLRL